MPEVQRQFEADISLYIGSLIREFNLPPRFAAEIREHKWGHTLAEVRRNLRKRRCASSL
jgi:hypothetical protein